jgi:TPR repeat protein
MIRVLLLSLVVIVTASVVGAARADTADDVRAAAARGDYDGALSVLRRAAIAGDVQSQFSLGKVLYFGQWPSVKADRAEGLKWIRAAADRGNVDAQLLLARETKDRAESLNWYEKAALNGSPLAQERLSKAYWWGEGRRRDVKTAIQWSLKAAEGGNPNAQLVLGVQYAIGQVIPQDFAQSRHWFLKLAAVVGSDGTTAQTYLGTFYEKGLGVPPNYGQAIRWYEDAAKTYSPYAEFALGTLHEFGRGVPVNLDRALHYYRASAFKRYEPAQYRLGVAYLRGEGVRRDRAEALKWLAFAIHWDEITNSASPQHETVRAAFERDPDLFHLLTGQLRPEAFNYALTVVQELAKDPALYAKAKALAASFEPTPPPLPIMPH